MEQIITPGSIIAFSYGPDYNKTFGQVIEVANDYVYYKDPVQLSLRGKVPLKLIQDGRSTDLKNLGIGEFLMEVA